MVAITAKRTVHVSTAWGFTIQRPAGVSFLLTEYHASQAPREIFTRLAPFETVPRYDDRPLGQDSLAVVWIAGLGDTVSLVPGLTALQAVNPHAPITVITIPSLYEVLDSAGFDGDFIEYPPRQSDVERFD